MSWLREHRWGLGVAVAAAAVLTASLIYFDVLPITSVTPPVRVVSAGSDVETAGQRLSDLKGREVDGQNLLPDGTVLYLVDLTVEQIADEANCVYVHMVEAAGAGRVYMPFNDYEILNQLGEMPQSCLLSLDGASDRVTVSFVLPRDYDAESLRFVLGGLIDESVEIALVD